MMGFRSSVAPSVSAAKIETSEAVQCLKEIADFLRPYVMKKVTEDVHYLLNEETMLWIYNVAVHGVNAARQRAVDRQIHVGRPKTEITVPITVAAIEEVFERHRVKSRRKK